MSIFIGIFTLILVAVAIFLILVVLAQKPKSDGGMGAALGGGMAEATFGADTGNVLSKATINSSIAFFVLAFILYLAQIYAQSHHKADNNALPSIAAPAETKATDAAADAVKTDAAATQPEAAVSTTTDAKPEATADKAVETPAAPSADSTKTDSATTK